MEPLLGDVPLVGALSLFFLKKPVSPDSGGKKKKERRRSVRLIHSHPAEVNDAAVWGNALEAIKADLLWPKCKTCF